MSIPLRRTSRAESAPAADTCANSVTMKSALWWLARVLGLILFIGLFGGWGFLAFRIGVVGGKKGSIHHNNHAPAETSKQPECKWQRPVHQPL